MARNSLRHHNPYPARLVDENRAPIMVYISDSRPAKRFNEDVHTLLRHLHYNAGSRTSSMIIQGLLNRGGHGKQVVINWDKPHRNAETFNPSKGKWDGPGSTDADFMANPGRGDASTVTINPWEWPAIGSGPPGFSRDEILLHELVHAFMSQRGISSVRKLNRSKYVRRVRMFDIVDDFYTIMITNVYASECGRPPRRNHLGFNLLGRTAAEVRADPDFKRFFDALEAHAPDVVATLKAINTGFNPWNVTN